MFKIGIYIAGVLLCAVFCGAVPPGFAAVQFVIPGAGYTLPANYIAVGGRISRPYEPMKRAPASKYYETVPVNFVFDGWYSGEKKWDFESDTVTGDMTLTARWRGGSSFWMGSSDKEAGREADEPRHRVSLSKSFYMGRFPVTQELYAKIMGENPSYFSEAGGYRSRAGNRAEKRPVEQISWYDALVFCNRLSVLDGLAPVYSIAGSTDPAAWGYVPENVMDAKWDAVIMLPAANGWRLPTEAEWEFACRAGKATAFNSGNDIAADAIGWYADNSGDMTHEVGRKAPNAWGLCDMHGNVWEWVWDWYDHDYYADKSAALDPMGSDGHDPIRVMRGGSWYNYARFLRSAYRNFGAPWQIYEGLVGIRLARTAQ